MASGMMMPVKELLERPRDSKKVRLAMEGGIEP